MMINPIKKILKFNADREPERLAMKYRNMRADPFVFMRATCHLFYAQLPDAPVLHDAPSAWACGDLHLENFGSYKGDNRLVYFDINDFDEAILTPATWDIVRFMSSVIVGHKSLKVTSADAISLCDLYLKSYAHALSKGQARWIERDVAQPPVGDLLESLRHRSRAEFLDRRTVLHRRQRRINLENGKALPVSDLQREQLMALFKEWSAHQSNPKFYDVLDVARRIAGNGSLGVDRYIVLVNGKGSPDGNYLLDLKEARPSALRKRVQLHQPPWANDAERIISVQQSMQAIPMAFLQPVKMGKVDYVMRGLQPSEDRVELTQTRHSQSRLSSLMTTLGPCTAWAQLRSSGRKASATADALMDFGRRPNWQGPLIDVARSCALNVVSDWKRYCEAFDQGQFS